MKTILALLLTVVGWSCFAAPGQPYFAKNSAVESELPPGMKFWFTAKDLTNSPVMEWRDRIAGTYWWQTNSSEAPTWSTNGVHFNGTNQFLFATNGSGNTIIPEPLTEPFLLVFRYETFTNPPNAFLYNQRMLIGQTLSGGAMFLSANAASQPSPNGYLYNQVGANALSIFTNVIDLIGAPKSTGPSTWFTMTNGVSALSDSSAWNDIPLITLVGRGFYNGGGIWVYTTATLMEFICWTNATGANIWTTNTVAKVHHYATTNWNFSP